MALFVIYKKIVQFPCKTIEFSKWKKVPKDIINTNENHRIPRFSIYEISNSNSGKGKKIWVYSLIHSSFTPV